MRPYGLPRDKEMDEYPDVATIHYYGRASHWGHLPTKSGEYKSNFRNTDKKARIRRRWKKKFRRLINHPD